MNKKRLKKRDKKWKKTSKSVEVSGPQDTLRLQREFLGLELCSTCDHTYPREMGLCPKCA